MAKDPIAQAGRDAVKRNKERRKQRYEMDKLKDTKIARLEAEVMRKDDEIARLRDELKKSKAV